MEIKQKSLIKVIFEYNLQKKTHALTYSDIKFLIFTHFTKLNFHKTSDVLVTRNS